LVLFIGLSGCSEKEYYTPQDDPAKTPVVTTGIPTAITAFGATVAGTLQERGDTIVDCGFAISTTPGFEAPQVRVATRPFGNDFSINITGLEDNTTYYIKAFATSHLGGTGFGEAHTITTLEAPDQWEGMEGTWTVTEDFYYGSAWYNNQSYDMVITGVPGNKTRVKIVGFAAYMEDNHEVYATIMDMKLTLTSQELIPGWDEPDYRTYFAGVMTGTFGDDVGKDLPVATITLNPSNKHQLTLLGGVGTYSYYIYDMDATTGAYAGVWGYCRNTRWVQQ